MLIPSWSHSRYSDFEKCKFRAYLLHVEKAKEPERPLAPGKLEQANDRGTRIHDGCEKYVRGDIPDMPIEARKHFGPEMEAMRRLYRAGCVSLEGEWGMNQNWEPCGWNGDWLEVEDKSVPIDLIAKALPARPKPGMTVKMGRKVFLFTPAWLRLKLDALVFESPKHAVAIDYKSGKKFGNEAKHGEQLQLYQLCTFLRYPELEKVTTELWYFDADDLSRQQFTRRTGMAYQRLWDNRGTKITTCTEFPPNGNAFSCRWCYFGEREGGSGICKSGVF